MISRVKARAFANIALVKYWGKRNRERNLPATSSISIALDALATETEVQRATGGSDTIEIDGTSAEGGTLRRISNYMDVWRDGGLVSGHFAIVSRNCFPTGTGLASSASGFAALATALSGFAEKKINALNLSRLARLGSGSAARSIPGGLAILPTGTNPASRLLAAHDEIPWGMVIAITEETPKPISSTEAMELSRRNSPFYKSWLAQSRLDCAKMMEAVDRRDLRRVGTIGEENALAMHACIMATRPSIIYWNGVTVELIKSAGRFRSSGIETYFTVDAGPNVAFLCKIGELDAVTQEVGKIGGVRSIIVGRPAGGAEIVECH